jgi:CMP-N,N'-diacetyllegionaminic acid synthase
VRVLGLIPARGGSKGVPGKNIRPLAGKSLVERASECALASGVLDRVILSTDDSGIAEAARGFGLEVPFLRPGTLGRDDTAMVDVVVHALETLAEQGYDPDAVLLIQPTSPLRRPEHLRRAVELLGPHDAVCSVVALPADLCPHYVMRIDPSGFLDHFLPEGAGVTRRQDVPPAYRRDGTIFLTRSQVLLEQRSFYGRRCIPMLLAAHEALNIDEPADWAAAERRIAAGVTCTP